MVTTGTNLAGHVQTRPGNVGHQTAGDLGDILHHVPPLLDHLLLLWVLTHPGPVHGAGGAGGAGHELCLQEAGVYGIITLHHIYIGYVAIKSWISKSCKNIN